MRAMVRRAVPADAGRSPPLEVLVPDPVPAALPFAPPRGRGARRPVLAEAVAQPQHRLDERPEGSPVVVPVPRSEAGWWPGDGDVAWVPAELLLAASGRCSCVPCVELYVAERARAALRVVR
jgi:hypothetical protein